MKERYYSEIGIRMITAAKYPIIQVENKGQNLNEQFQSKNMKPDKSRNKQNIFSTYIQEMCNFPHEFYLEKSEVSMSLFSCFQRKSSRSSHSTVYREFVLNRC